MMTAPTHLQSLYDALGHDAGRSGRFIASGADAVSLDLLRTGTSLGGRLPALAGRSVLVATKRQITTALALLELDGVAGRIVLCPPGLWAEHRSEVIAKAGVDAIVSDRANTAGLRSAMLEVACGCAIEPAHPRVPHSRLSEWVLLTSGTTGAPKLVLHDLATLTRAIKHDHDQAAPIIWGTFYDIRRYGGLQIFLRGILCGGSLVLSSEEEQIGRYLERAGARGVTHLSGTPSHWRSALAFATITAISPRYLRLSGEIADQGILDQLRARFPHAAVVHAYASTEAGVGFEVDDGHEGFPAELIGRHGADPELKLAEGTLRLRSARTALCYLGADAPALKDADGFVDTGDLVALDHGRYRFVGRRDGVINVGGLKVHPEEVEAVINRHPNVRASLVHSRRNFITGGIVVADVVLRRLPADEDADDRSAEIRTEILAACRRSLAGYKVPAAIRFVPMLEIDASGKPSRAQMP